jgi:hypothetical protein
MGLHQDRDEGDLAAPVLSVSGDSCLFRIGGPRCSDPTQSFRLASGDALVLGGEARLAYHGVDRILPGTSTLLPEGGRINLTLRRGDLAGWLNRTPKAAVQPSQRRSAAAFPSHSGWAFGPGEMPMTRFRWFSRILFLPVLFGAAVAAQAAEVVFPTGSRIGIAPPPGVATSPRFVGFEDAAKKVAILVIALPPEAYAELEKSTGRLSAQGATVEQREDLSLDPGKAFLVVARQKSATSACTNGSWQRPPKI